MDAVAAAELLLQRGASSGPALAEATARDSTRVLALLQAAATAEAAPRAAVAPRGGQGPAVADEEEQAEATLQTGDLAVFLAALGIYDDYDDTFEAEGIRYGGVQEGMGGYRRASGMVPQCCDAGHSVSLGICPDNFLLISCLTRCDCTVWLYSWSFLLCRPPSLVTYIWLLSD